MYDYIIDGCCCCSPDYYGPFPHWNVVGTFQCSNCLQAFEIRPQFCPVNYYGPKEAYYTGEFTRKRIKELGGVL